MQVKDDQASLPCLEPQSEILKSQDSLVLSLPATLKSISNHDSCFSAPSPNSCLRAPNNIKANYVNITNIPHALAHKHSAGIY